MVAPTDAKALGITDNAKPEVEVLPTKLEMIDKKIFATSGKATLEMEKKEVIFEAKNKISLKAGGNIVVEGGPKILINSGTAGNVAQLGSMSTKQEVAEARNALAARIGLVHGNAEPKESRTWKNTATSVDALAEDAKKAEPTLKSIIADAAEASGGEPNYGPGNAHALKAKDGLRDKVEKRGKPLATISDAVRGTIIVDSPEELGRASEVLTAAVEKAGGKIVYDNKFTYQNPAGYAGLHADVFLPTGDGGMVRSEIQLHLRDINNGKMLNEDPNNPKEKAHALYELSRKPTTPPEQRDALLEQQREIYLTGMQNALARPAS
jgi:hypothetical protein